MPRVVLIGTCDTKLEELLYLRSQILENGGSGCNVMFVDVGRTPVKHEAITVPQNLLTSKYAPEENRNVAELARGDMIKYMICCATRWMKETYQRGIEDPPQAIHGAISAGGTGGTSLASGIMRDALPIGLPKLIVSTNASGDTGPVVGECDISMTYSVVDIAGSNSLLRRILSNAAGAIVGMSHAYERSKSHDVGALRKRNKSRVGLTMFGVTTPCVDAVRHHLESNYAVECFVFHCTGHGGMALERLIEAEELDAVLDITTTELCDHICGGVMSAGPGRLETALGRGIPCVISVGATDMVNFGPKPTVPEKYQARKLYEHNPTVTLMRTSPEECGQVGALIVEKIKKFALDKAKVKVMLPLGGASILATPGAPFYDADADKTIFSTIQDGLDGFGVEVIADDRAINDHGFALNLAQHLVDLMDL